MDTDLLLVIVIAFGMTNLCALMWSGVYMFSKAGKSKRRKRKPRRT